VAFECSLTGIGHQPPVVEGGLALGRATHATPSQSSSAKASAASTSDSLGGLST
jgi:hypothetical protein